MALWDIAAKIARQPLYALLAKRVYRDTLLPDRIKVYAGGGYPYPDNDTGHLADEMRRIADLGFTHAKMKIVRLPQSPGIGFELNDDIMRTFKTAFA